MTRVCGSGAPLLLALAASALSMDLVPFAALVVKCIAPRSSAAIFRG